jgi:hypothetical protein
MLDVEYNETVTRKLSINIRNLVEIGEAMTDEQSSSYLDLETAEVTRIVHGFDTDIDYENLKQQIEDNLDTRYISIPNYEPWLGYNDMEAFIQVLEETRLQNKLAAAIVGKCAFRRFKDVLLGYPGYREQWFAFQAARQETRAREWLESKGFSISIKPDD